MSENRNKQIHIKDINIGLMKNARLLTKYDITMDDVVDKNKLHPQVLEYFEGKVKGNLNQILKDIDSITRNERTKKKTPSELSLSKTSNDNYKSRLSQLNKIFDCDNDLTCLNNPKKILDTFNRLKLPTNTILSYINTIIGTTKYSPTFQKILTNIDDYKIIQRKLIEKREKQLEDDINNKDVVLLKELLEIQSYYEKNEQYSFNHLISSLYTMIPPLRDDFGNVELIENDKDDDDFNNFYNTKTKTLILNKYKGSDFKGKYKIVFPDKLHTIIIESVKKQPRLFLITKNENNAFDTLYTRGRLTNIIKNVFFGNTVNDIRHAYATHDFKGKGIDVLKLKKDSDDMLHSLGVHLTYLRGIKN
jgi:hypothetical protein